jgi:outer membrane protein
VIPAGLLALSIAAGASSDPEQIITETLTLERAVALAREHHPSLRQARADTEAAEAKRTELRSPLLPQLEVDLSYLRTTANFVRKPGVAPPLLTPAETFSTFNFFSGSVSATQLIYDFGRTIGQWRSADALAASQQANERVTMHDVVFNVESSYFAASAFRELIGVAQETFDNQDRHLKQIERFVAAGARPEIDLAQARTDRAQAEVQLIQAQNVYASSKALLNQAMGVEQSIEYEVAGAELSREVAGEGAPISQLLADALSARPEIARLDKMIEAEERVIDATRGDYFPVLSAATALTESGPHLDGVTWNWNAQVLFSWPIFEGFKTFAQVDEARAALASLIAQKDALRQSVRLDVEQARVDVRGAKATLASAEQALTNARERYRLAEGRYKAGTGNVIELGDAQVALTTSSVQRVRSKYDLATARTHLLHALGRE